MAIEYTKERLILCEGSSDKTFFCELIRERGLPDFQVQFPHGANETTGGVNKFHRFLEGTALNEEFLNKVRGVLVVADNDDNPGGQFYQVTTQIMDAGYGVPRRELLFVRSHPPLPPIAVMMLPLNQQLGNLETVVKQAALNKWPDLAAPLEAYIDEAPASGWAQGKQDKMRVQCILAATCEANPYVTISTLYRENVRYHIPLSDPCFDPIAQALTNFDAMVAAAT